LHDLKISLPAKKNIASQNRPLMRKNRNPNQPSRLNQLRLSFFFTELNFIFYYYSLPKKISANLGDGYGDVSVTN